MEVTNDLAVNTEEAAALLRTTVNNIHRLRQTGCLNGIKLGKTFIFSIAEINRFLTDFEGADLSNEFAMKQANKERGTTK